MITSSLPQAVQSPLLRSEVAQQLGDDLRREIGKHLGFFSPKDERQHLNMKRSRGERARPEVELVLLTVYTNDQ